MIPEDTYIFLTHKLVRNLDADHAVLAATIVGMCSSTDDGTKVISLEFLATILNFSKRTIQRQLQKLLLLQVIEYESGDGRGNYGKFKKGTNFDILSGIKGDSSDILLDQKRVTNFAKKGDKNGHLIIKDINKGEDAHAHARTSNPSSFIEVLNKEQGVAPCSPLNNESMNFPFDAFWTAFKVDPAYEHERESCERQWSVMSDLLRDDIMKCVRSRRAKNPNPHWFLHDYKPTSLDLMPVGSVVSYEKYYSFYNTTIEKNGWVRRHLEKEQRTIYERTAV